MYNFLQSEKSQQPPIDDIGRDIALGWVFPFVVYVVPEVNFRLSLVCLSELFNNWQQTIHILLELTINIELPQKCQLFFNLLPILQVSSHVDIHNSTTSPQNHIVEVFLEAVHDNSG